MVVCSVMIKENFMLLILFWQASNIFCLFQFLVILTPANIMTELLVPISIIIFKVDFLMDISGVEYLASSGKMVLTRKIIKIGCHG